MKNVAFQITFDRVVLPQCLKCEWRKNGMKEKIGWKNSKDCPNVIISLAKFGFCSTSHLMSSSLLKAFWIFYFLFFLFTFDSYQQSYLPIARLLFMKITGNHFSINIDFLWLVMWIGVTGLWKNRYKGSKKVCGFYYFL